MRFFFIYVIVIISFQSIYGKIPELKYSQSVSNDGHFVLFWDSVQNDSILLEEKRENDWHSIQTKKDTSTTISGKPNGIYQYRLRNKIETSKTISIQVKHHNYIRTLIFFFTGFFVFFLTVTMILIGNKKTKNE